MAVLDIPLESQPFHYEEAVSTIVYSMNPRDVVLTMVDGEILVQDRQLVQQSEDDIIGDARKSLAVLQGR